MRVPATQDTVVFKIPSMCGQLNARNCDLSPRWNCTSTYNADSEVVIISCIVLTKIYIIIWQVGMWIRCFRFM